MGFRQNPLLGYWKRGCEFPTKAEAALETVIAALGERYRHQYPFWGLKYFADFALLDSKIIIEVDGDSHDTPEQKEKDLLHELAVLELGWVVMRISNEKALRYPDLTDLLLRADEIKRLGKEFQETQLTEALARLHRDYPHLLAEAAKRSTSRRRSALKSAKTRREAKAGAAAPRRKRATPVPSPA